MMRMTTQPIPAASVGVAIPKKIDPIMAVMTAMTGHTFFSETSRVAQLRHRRQHECKKGAG